MPYLSKDEVIALYKVVQPLLDAVQKKIIVAPDVSLLFKGYFERLVHGFPIRGRDVKTELTSVSGQTHSTVQTMSALRENTLNVLEPISAYIDDISLLLTKAGIPNEETRKQFYLTLVIGHETKKVDFTSTELAAFQLLRSWLIQFANEMNIQLNVATGELFVPAYPMALVNPKDSSTTSVSEDVPLLPSVGRHAHIVIDMSEESSEQILQRYQDELVTLEKQLRIQKIKYNSLALLSFFTCLLPGVTGIAGAYSMFSDDPDNHRGLSIVLIYLGGFLGLFIGLALATGGTAELKDKISAHETTIRGLKERTGEAFITTDPEMTLETLRTHRTIFVDAIRAINGNSLTEIAAASGIAKATVLVSDSAPSEGAGSGDTVDVGVPAYQEVIREDERRKESEERFGPGSEARTNLLPPVYALVSRSFPVAPAAAPSASGSESSDSDVDVSLDSSGTESARMLAS